MKYAIYICPTGRPIRVAIVECDDVDKVYEWASKRWRTAPPTVEAAESDAPVTHAMPE